MNANPERMAFGTRGSALVMIDDHRAALATVLVLQEMGMSVDIAGDPASALAWSKMANYAVIVYGGGTLLPGNGHWDEFARGLRVASPRSRILQLGLGNSVASSLSALNIDVLSPPLNVNRLVEHLAAA